MYQTCMFCNKPLGTNEVVEEFPVGRLGGAGTGPHREAVTRGVRSLALRGPVGTAEATRAGVGHRRVCGGLGDRSGRLSHGHPRAGTGIPRVVAVVPVREGAVGWRSGR